MREPIQRYPPNFPNLLASLDILFLANRLANVDHGWRDPALSEPFDDAILRQLFDAEALRTLLADSADDVASLKNALST